jgi:cbb3-type cytochrome oxidase subunit 3
VVNVAFTQHRAEKVISAREDIRPFHFTPLVWLSQGIMDQTVKMLLWGLFMILFIAFFAFLYYQIRKGETQYRKARENEQRKEKTNGL